MVASRITTGREGFAEAALEAREYALGLPPLAEQAIGKPFVHQHSISARRALVAAPIIDRDGRGPYAELLSAKHVEGFAVVGGVGEDATDVQMRGGLANRRFEPRRVVARAERQIHTGDQMCGVVAGGGEFGKGAELLRAALPFEEIAADVATLQAGGVDADVRRTGDQAASIRASENSAEQVVESPPFSICASAFCSVVKCGMFGSPRSSRKSEKSARMETMPR